MADYSANCDWLRERYKFDNNVSIYTLVDKMVDEIKSLEVKPSQTGEVECPKTSSRPLKSKSPKSKLK
jgi:hypothetical protein